ncbi:8034_t:CDS:2 [Ambispora gerdemannii]|uniref:8034_t:CDS:1 n=1 Tax=Ambispora gerdemannii TaxID=144530 RepID=A0A9N8UYU3_9GLOM|nr:8034_t:CDS:2 [Ambispora gerdemannii]
MELRVLGKFSPFGETFIHHNNIDDSGQASRAESRLQSNHHIRPSFEPTYQLYPSQNNAQTNKPKNQSSDFEEELYVKDKLVVWSRGNLLKKSFKFESPVIQALFVWFENYTQTPQQNSLDTNSYINNVLIRERCLCIILHNSAKVYFENGDSHAFRIPSIQRAWALELGILFECFLEDNPCLSESMQDDSIPTPPPTLLSLLDPLAEIKAVSIVDKILYNNEELVFLGPMNPFTNADEELIFVGGATTNDPLIFTYNRQTGRQYLYRYGIKRGSNIIGEMENPGRRSSGLKSDLVDRFLHPDSQNFLSYERRDFSEASVEVYLELLWSENYHPSGSINDLSAFIAHESNGGKVFGIFTRSTETLTLLDILQERDQHRISFKSQFSALAAMSISSTRPNLLDILMLKKDGTLELWIGSDKFLPITVPNEDFFCMKEESLVNRVIDIKDCVQHRVNIVLSDDMVLRTSLNFILSSTLVRSCMGSLSFAIPVSEYLEFKLRFLQYTFGNANKYMEIPQASEWENFIVTLLSFCHTNPSNDVSMSDDDQNTSILYNDDDWNALLSIPHHRKIDLNNIYQSLEPTNAHVMDNSIINNYEKSKRLAVLFSFERNFQAYLPSILYALHLLYEDLKLNVILQKYMQYHLPLLMQLASLLGWESYLDYYTRHNITGKSLKLTKDTINTEEIEYNKSILSPPNIYQWILYRLRTKGVITQFPSVHDIGLLFNIPCPEIIRDFDCCTRTLKVCGFCNELFAVGPASMILKMVQEGFKLKDVDALPFGIALPLREAIRKCRMRPPNDWPGDAYILIGREDLAELISGNPIATTYFHSRRGLKLDRKPDDIHSICQSVTPFEASTSNNPEISNHEISDLRFDRDRRLVEVQRLLHPSNIIKLSSVGSDQNGNEGDISGRNLEWISAHCMKNFAQPVGRGILTYGTTIPIATEVFPIPGICTSVRILPSNTVRVLDRGLRSQEIIDWPEFHDGVAAGLRITRESTEVDGSWIALNKPKELSNGHAGFLLGLGLNGHLRSLGAWRAVDYLMKTPKHDMTSIALVIGIPASYCETMDTQITKLVGVHVPALLPPNSTSLNVSSLIQTAAVLGIGLLFLGTCHRRMAQVMLGEIGGKSLMAAENTEIDYREGYSLAAGFALGFITLGRGHNAPGLADLDIFKELRLLITGGKGKNSSAPSQSSGFGGSRPGDINVNTTSLGATIALGLMFLKTNNESVADKITIPKTAYFLDFVRPDFLAVRILSKNLIMWDSIECNVAWVENHIPAFIKEKLEKNPDDDNIESIKQSYYYILAGACFSIGLKYAGSVDEVALHCLLHYLDFFMARASARATSFDQRITHQTVKTCVNVLTTSAGIVMAGTGNLELLRRLRKLHRPEINHVISRNYGSHMATSMALGFLFLGGGTFTLSTSNKAIAALVCSLFPRWPTDPTDNRTHMQAFRHLWVLALEPRCLVVRDVETREACHMPVKVIIRGTEESNDAQIAPGSSNKIEQMVAPCLLPEAKFVERIEIDTPRYWPISLDLRNNRTLANRFWQNPIIYVKRKMGHLSYLEDPQSIWSLNSRLFPRKTPSNQSTGGQHSSNKWEFVKVFSSDPQVLAFARHFCENEMDRDLATFCTGVLQECLNSDKPEAIQIYLALYQSQQNLNMNVLLLWNIKILLAYYEHAVISCPDATQNHALIQNAFVTSIRQNMNKFFSLSPPLTTISSESEQSQFARALQYYFTNLKFPSAEESEDMNANGLLIQLANFLVYNDVPDPKTIRNISSCMQSLRANFAQDTNVIDDSGLVNDHVLNVLLAFSPHLTKKIIQTIVKMLS